jgi:hypothetical protein
MGFALLSHVETDLGGFMVGYDLPLFAWWYMRFK